MRIDAAVPIVKVTDAAAASRFYADRLGFKVDWTHRASSQATYVGVSRDGARLHLTTFAGDGVIGTAVYFYVEDVDALRADFRRRGLDRVELEPTDQSWGMREIYVLDPDGTSLRFGAPVAR